MNLGRIPSTICQPVFSECLLHALSHGWSFLHVCRKVLGLPSKDWPNFWTFVHRRSPRVRNFSPDYLYSFHIFEDSEKDT